MGMNIEKITRDLFGKLDKRGIDYCVYNGYEGLPRRVDSDLDIAIEKGALKLMDKIILEVAEENSVYVLHKIWHDPGKIAYLLSPPRLAAPERLQLDFFTEFSIREYPKNSLHRFLLLDNKELLSQKKKKDYFYIPSPEMEFLMKFFRRLFKGDFNEEKFRRIKALYRQDEEKAKEKIRVFLPKNHGEVERALEEEDYSWFQENRKSLIKELRKYRWKYFTPKRIFLNFKRTLFRISHPVGMTVALLGPDGSGKTTLAKGLVELLSRSFHGQKIFYWRPGLLKQPGVALGLREEVNLGTNPDPHGHKPENPLKSLLRFVYYLIDFTLGYWLKVWPLKVKKYICIFDRYYYDVLVDPFRYNFSLPKLLLQIPSPIVPNPDVAVILISSPHVLSLRKSELKPEELKRQIKAFKELSKALKNSVLVETDEQEKYTLDKITQIILARKAIKTKKMLNP